MLAAAMEAHDIKVKDVIGRGLSGTVVWRVRKHQGQPTIEAAERLRQRINKLKPEAGLPPPSVGVESEAHFRWVEMGAKLLLLDENTFHETFKHVAGIVSGVERKHTGSKGLDDLLSAGGGGDRSE
jgi:hypothetical protein